MENSPLVEIIAELRWGPGKPLSMGQPPQIALGGDEGIYVRFGMEMGKLGFHQLERIHPEGFPSLAGNIVYRYRKADSEQNTLYQLGPGVFTCNALPPYNSWDEFAPKIRDGLQALWAIDAVPVGEPVELILRYVDAFGPSHLQGTMIPVFFKTFIGVQYAQLESVRRFSGGADPNAMRFFASYRGENGSTFTVDTGQGIKDGQEVVVLNTVVQSQPFQVASADEAFQQFEPLQSLLHECFFEMLGRNQEISRRVTG